MAPGASGYPFPQTSKGYPGAPGNYPGSTGGYPGYSPGSGNQPGSIYPNLNPGNPGNPGGYPLGPGKICLKVNEGVQYNLPFLQEIQGTRVPKLVPQDTHQQHQATQVHLP